VKILPLPVFDYYCGEAHDEITGVAAGGAMCQLEQEVVYYRSHE
jgi:hypothetical protein